MKDLIPSQPYRRCHICQQPFTYLPNPEWEAIQRYLKSTEARQNGYWLIKGHSDCFEKEKRDNLDESNKLQNQTRRSNARLIMQGLGFAGYVSELRDGEKEIEINEYNRLANEALDKWTFNKTGILLYGGPGRGKTSLMAKFGAKYNTMDVSVGFINITKLLAVLRQGYDDNSHDQRLQFVSSEIQILILDDLGAEKPTEWAQEKIYMVINDRLTRQLPVFITTNCGTGSDTVESTEKQLLEKFHPRLVSRLKEMCDWIKVDGFDWRDKINKDRLKTRNHQPDLRSQNQIEQHWDRQDQIPHDRDLRNRATKRFF